MTIPEFRAACEAFEVTAPVTVDDCREIYAELKPKLDLLQELDVMCVPEIVNGRHEWRTIRVTVGIGSNTHAIELQADAAPRS